MFQASGRLEAGDDACIADDVIRPRQTFHVRAMDLPVGHRMGGRPLVEERAPQRVDRGRVADQPPAPRHHVDERLRDRGVGPVEDRSSDRRRPQRCLDGSRRARAHRACRSPRRARPPVRANARVARHAAAARRATVAAADRSTARAKSTGSIWSGRDSHPAATQVRLATGERALGAGEVSERSTMVGGVGHHRPRAEIVEQQPTAVGVDRDDAGDEPGQLAVEELRDRSFPAERLEHRLEPVAPARGVDPHHRRYAPLTELDDARSAAAARTPPTTARSIPWPRRTNRAAQAGRSGSGPERPSAFVEPAVQAFGQSRFDRHRALVGRRPTSTRPVIAALDGESIELDEDCHGRMSGSTDSVWSMRQSMIGSSNPSVEASARVRAATVISPSSSSNSIDGNRPAPSTITDPGEWPGIINRAIRRSPIRVQVSENSGLRFSRLAVTAST